LGQIAHRPAMAHHPLSGSPIVLTPVGGRARRELRRARATHRLGWRSTAKILAGSSYISGGVTGGGNRALRGAALSGAAPGDPDPDVRGNRLLEPAYLSEGEPEGCHAVPSGCRSPGSWKFSPACWWAVIASANRPTCRLSQPEGAPVAGSRCPTCSRWRLTAGRCATAAHRCRGPTPGSADENRKPPVHLCGRA
jgi:hypothetical protein